MKTAGYSLCTGYYLHFKMHIYATNFCFEFILLPNMKFSVSILFLCLHNLMERT